MSPRSSRSSRHPLVQLGAQVGDQRVGRLLARESSEAPSCAARTVLSALGHAAHSGAGRQRSLSRLGVAAVVKPAAGQLPEGSPQTTHAGPAPSCASRWLLKPPHWRYPSSSSASGRGHGPPSRLAERIILGSELPRRLRPDAVGHGRRSSSESVRRRGGTSVSAAAGRSAWPSQQQQRLSEVELADHRRLEDPLVATSFLEAHFPLCCPATSGGSLARYSPRMWLRSSRSVCCCRCRRGSA